MAERLLSLERHISSYAALVFGLVLILLSEVSSAADESSKFSKTDYDQLEKDYVAAAFGGDYAQLTKFSSVTPLTRSFECASSTPEKCLATVSLFKYSVSESDLLWLEMIKGRSDLRLILADRDRLPALQTELEGLFKLGTFDNSSADCQLYLSVAGAVITSAITVISLDSDPLRAQTCLIVNFYRSLGLSLGRGKSFANVWGPENNPRTDFTSADYEELKYRSNVLLLIHACKKLRPGMTKREVQLELTPDSECLKILEVMSNG